MQNFIGRTPLLSGYLSYVNLCSSSENQVFQPFFEFPAPRGYYYQKTIGAYTESISVGPELMQSQVANQH